MENVYNLRSSKQQQPLYEVIIDFDEASAAWRQNKKKLPNGTFSYICGMITKNGKPCQRPESHRHFHNEHKHNC